jgi:cell division protein FtsL
MNVSNLSVFELKEYYDKFNVDIAIDSLNQRIASKNVEKFSIQEQIEELKHTRTTIYETPNMTATLASQINEINNTINNQQHKLDGILKDIKSLYLIKQGLVEVYGEITTIPYKKYNPKRKPKIKIPLKKLMCPTCYLPMSIFKIQNNFIKRYH